MQNNIEKIVKRISAYETIFSPEEKEIIIKSLSLYGSELNKELKAEKDLDIESDKSFNQIDSLSFQMLFNTIIEAIAVVELMYNDSGKPDDYIFRDVNPAFAQQNHEKRELIIHSSAKKLYQKSNLELINNVISTKKPRRFVHYNDLTDEHFNVSVFPLERNKAVIVSEDITDFKRLEKELADKLAFQDALIDSIPYPVFIKDAEARFVGCNRAYEKEFGTTRQYMYGKTVLDLEYLPMDERIKFQEEDMRVIKEASSKSYELPIIYADGKTHTSLYSVDGFKLANGEPGGLIGLLVDITERKQNEEERRKSEEKYRALVENNFDIIWETNAELVFSYISPQIKNLLGYEQSEFIGKTLCDLINPAEVPDFRKMMHYYKQNPEPRTGIINSYIHKSGELIFMEFNFIPFRDENGLLSGFRGITREITQRIKSEQERIKLNNLESLSILAGGIAHDFRNILTVINGQATIALLKSSDDNIKKNLSSILDAAKNAVNLTQQLFTFAENEVRKDIPIDLENVLKELVRNLFTGTNIICNFTFANSSVFQGDSIRIRQMLQNILTNSKEAMLKGGNLIVRTSDVIENNKSFIKIVIEDTGVGIKQEYLNKIFDPYFSTKTRHKVKGSGLGLSVCHSIVQRYGGKITVSSEEGKWTKVEILLPASK